MARGFLSGALWGVVVAGLGAGVASVVTGPVMAPEPGSVSAVAPSVSAPQAPSADAPPATTPDRPVPAPQTTSPGVPTAPDGSGAPRLQTQPAPVPETSGTATTPTVPADLDAPSTPDPINTQTPVVSDDPGAQPVAPGADGVRLAEPTIAPPEPQPAPETEPEPAPEPVPEPSSAPDVAAATPQGERAEADTDVAEVAEDTETAPANAAPTGVEDDTASEPAETPEQPTTSSETVATEDSTPSLPQAGDATDDVAVGDDTSQPALAPSVGSGASDFSQLNTGVTTNRLVTAVQPEPSTTQDDLEREPVSEPVAEVVDEPPLQAFAEDPAAEIDRPMMSIVLIDDGSQPLGLEALDNFPYPLTFAVDTGWSGATEAMARYRSAGFEVMALVDMPTAATPSDVEVSLRAALDLVPEAVAVLEGDETGVQGSRDVSTQVSDILAETGHGLVLYPKGLGTAIALADRAGVPTAPLFRDFDAQGQTATVIRRFLDQAAFKAGQEGAVVMLGRLRGETISALLIWGLQDRASRVSLVPISSVLTRETSG